MMVLMMVGCKTNTVIEKEYIYKDSIEWKDTTIFVELPRESVAVYCPILDTLRLSTSVADAVAYVDTSSNILRGYMKNKKTPIEYKTKFKERVVTIQKTNNKTTTVTKRYIPKWMLVLTAFLAILTAYNYRKVLLSIILKITS